MPDQISPFDQRRYQVRLEWGVDGLVRLAPSDVVVVVDVLLFSTAVTQAVSGGSVSAPHAAALPHAGDGGAVAEAASRTGAVVLIGCLRNASAVADAILDEQHRRGGRTSVAVIAAGEALRLGGPTRFAVEDLLGAGAVVDALTRRGVDHTSPEAAAAGEAFRGLGGAVRHLLTSSGTGQELLEQGLRDDVIAAAAVDAASVVPLRRAGAYVAR